MKIHHLFQLIIIIELLFSFPLCAQTTSPSAKLLPIKVSIDELQRLERYAQAQGIETKKETIPKKKEEKKEEEPKDEVSGITGILQGVGSSNNEAAAIIIFAVVGTVVIVLWFPYFFLFTRDLIRGDHHLYQYRQMFTLHASSFNEERDGFMYGGRYSLYTTPKEEETVGEYGLSLEAGYYQSREKNRFNKRVSHDGAYWLLGPSILFNLESWFLKLDFLAGSSFDQELGLISKADFSINKKLSSGATLGLGVGGQYFNIKDRNGVLKRDNDLSLSYGVIVGFDF